MISLDCEEFVTVSSWRSAVGNISNTSHEIILRHTSALVFLELLPKNMLGKKIDVYAKQLYDYENLNIRIVQSFNDIEYSQYGKLLCTTINQTINDMLADCIQTENNYEHVALYHTLCNYYDNYGTFDLIN